MSAEKALGVADADGAGAAHDDGLEVLAAHDRAGPPAAGLVALVGGEAGEGHEVLAGRAGGQDLVVRPDLGADRLLQRGRLRGPRTCLAGRNPTRSSSTRSRTGSGGSGEITASYPANLSSGANEPPTYESSSVPVAGLLHPTARREHVATRCRRTGRSRG